MSKESDDRFVKKREKIEYGVFGVIALTISLSIQFSPKMGNEYISLLFFSWSFYLLAFTLSGLRIVLDLEYDILFSQNRVYVNMIMSSEERMEKFEDLPEAYKKAFKERESESKKKLESEFHEKAKKSEFLRKFLFEIRFLHIIFYYAGVIFNILFTAFNFYSKSI